jgi:hypothetical protein
LIRVVRSIISQSPDANLCPTFLTKIEAEMASAAVLPATTPAIHQQPHVEEQIDAHFEQPQEPQNLPSQDQPLGKDEKDVNVPAEDHPSASSSPSPSAPASPPTSHLDDVDEDTTALPTIKPTVADNCCGNSTASASSSAGAKSTKSSSTAATAKSATSSASTSTLSKLAAIARATTRFQFITALIPSISGTKHAATLIQLQAPATVMAIDFKPLVLTPIDFSLTDGTDIPAPVLPDSPPMTPVDQKDKKIDELDLNKKDTDEAKDRVGALPTPTSPLSPRMSAQNSTDRPITGIRRFLSLRSLRSTNRLQKQNHVLSDKGSSNYSYKVSRPGTSLSVDSVQVSTDSPLVQSLKHKRSAGWFGSSRRRGSIPLEPTTPKKDAGPPAPTIPEVKVMEPEMGADDLFKDIN